MSSVTDELIFNFDVALINLNLTSHMWLMVTILDMGNYKKTFQGLP